MAIRGSLTEASLPDVLQLLSMGGKTGRLSLAHKQNFGFVFVENGRITNASVKGRDLKSEDAVYELFTWTEGTFDFEPAIMPDSSVEKVSLDPQPLMLEGARRVDEWTLIEKAIPAFDAIFALDRQKLLFSKLELSDDQRNLIPLFDGRRDVDSLVQESKLSEFAVGKALFGLMNAGFLVPLGKARPSGAQVPDDKIAEHKNLGSAFYHAGMLEEAEREYRRVAEGRPEDPVGPFFLGLIALRNGQWDEAAQCFETAAPKSEVKTAIYNNLAYAYERSGQLEKARLAMAKALSRGGVNDPVVQIGAAALALQTNDLRDAEIAVDTARKLIGQRRPSAAWFHYAAVSAMLAKDWDHALEHLDEGVELYPMSAPLLNNLAVVYEQRGEYTAALSAAERGVMTDNAGAQLYKNFGDALKRAGRGEEALAAYRRAEARRNA
jgi:tetratricopeptide (TPR) repeat protein